MNTGLSIDSRCGRRLEFLDRPLMGITGVPAVAPRLFPFIRRSRGQVISPIPSTRHDPEDQSDECTLCNDLMCAEV